MPLNIKDDDVHAQARTLARLTGVSMTEAVRTALASEIERVERAAQYQESVPTVAKLLDIARLCAEALKGRGVTSDHSEFYGTDGLPR